MTEPDTQPPRDNEVSRLVRLNMPEGGYKRSKRPYVIGALVVAVIVGLVVLIQDTVFKPTKLGTDYSAAQNALGDTHRVDDLATELFRPSSGKPCPGTPTATVTEAEAAAFVNPSDSSLLAELDRQSYDTGVAGCYIGADGVKIETAIFRVGTQGGARTVLQREFDASMTGGDTITTQRGNTVITGRQVRTGPLIAYAYGYRGVLMVTLRATPVTAPSIDPTVVGAIFDAQMDKIKADEAQ